MNTQSEFSPFSLQAIYIRESSTNLAASFNPTLGGQTLAGHFRTSRIGPPEIKDVISDQGESIQAIAFSAKFEFRYTKKSGNPADEDPSIETNVCASIEAKINVEYVLIGEKMPPEDYLNHWAATAALNHAWPYWREFCSSAMTKMNLPVLIVPLLDLYREEAANAKMLSRKKERLTPSKAPSKQKMKVKALENG